MMTLDCAIAFQGRFERIAGHRLKDWSSYEALVARKAQLDPEAVLACIEDCSRSHIVSLIETHSTDFDAQTVRDLADLIQSVRFWRSLL